MSPSTVANHAPSAWTRDELIELATALAEADDAMRHALLEARVSAGMSQRDVAKALGVKQSTISNFERHDNDPRLSTIRRYALAVRARVDHQVSTPSSTFSTDGWRALDLEADFVSPFFMKTVERFATASPADSKRTDFATAA